MSRLGAPPLTSVKALVKCRRWPLAVIGRSLTVWKRPDLGERTATAALLAVSLGSPSRLRRACPCRAAPPRSRWSSPRQNDLDRGGAVWRPLLRNREGEAVRPACPPGPSGPAGG